MRTLTGLVTLPMMLISSFSRVCPLLTTVIDTLHAMVEYKKRVGEIFRELGIARLLGSEPFNPNVSEGRKMPLELIKWSR